MIRRKQVKYKGDDKIVCAQLSLIFIFYSKVFEFAADSGRHIK